MTEDGDQAQTWQIDLEEIDGQGASGRLQILIDLVRELLPEPGLGRVAALLHAPAVVAEASQAWH